MNRQRLVRIVRWVVVTILLAPLLLWMGVTIGAKFTIGADAPFPQLAEMVGQALFGGVICAVVGCEAELPEGMEVTTFTDDLVQDVTVALDVDERGRVYVVETARQRAGGEDNRSHPYWLMDDLAARTIEDRAAYYEKALAEGRFETADHFTRYADRVVVLEDRDGDGKADERRVLAEWNEMLSGLIAGVEAREGTLWVTSVPSIYQLRDEDGDGIQEVVEELHRGFGVKTSLGGHDLHGLVWGPDGKLYFSMGDRGYHVELPDGRILEPSLGPGRGAVFRMNGDGSELEVFATGVRNPQELAFDDHGNLFTGDNNGDGGDQARLVYLVEGGETGWAMPYQTLTGDYIRGPWVAERLWELQHPTQPAWVLPPVAYIGNGPAGFVHYPGLGLPARYADHFFLCDYGYTPSRTGVWSFGVEPKGASFEMVDKHHFAWSLLTTDIDFGWNGRIYATVFDQLSMTQSLVSISDAESVADPRVAELTNEVAQPIHEKATPKLLELLAFPDQRLRLRAQYELVARGETDTLVGLARDAKAEAIPRLHALWGLGQLGEAGLRALTPGGLDWAATEDAEYRAQLMKIVGQARAGWLRAELETALGDASARVRFFAAQSLGGLGDRASIDPLFGLIRENADEDVYLRHAAMYALTRLNALEEIVAHASDPSRSVRLAVLLVLRRAGDARVERFLADADALLRVEAARAIYDGPIDAAMPALAALAEQLEPAAIDDLETGQALHRRVIGANVRLRSELGATALARYAADERQLESLREMALEALAGYATPPLRDLTMGFYRPLPALPVEILQRVFRHHGRALVASSLGPRALQIASEIGEMPLSGKELLEIVEKASAKPRERVAALRALQTAGDPDTARAAARGALAATDPMLRTAARELQFAVDPAAGLASLLSAVDDASTLSERQSAWRSLGAIDSPAVDARLSEALDAWARGELEVAVAYDVIAAAAKREDASLAARAEALLHPGFENLVESRRWALAGGDAAAGEVVFQTYGDCQRCHGGGGHDAGVGPLLAGVARKGGAHVLESILDPQAQIAKGFASVIVTRKDGSLVSGLLLDEAANRIRLAPSGVGAGAGDPVEIPRSEIASVSDPVTGMPPIGLGLEPAALRDVVAYVMSLE